MFIPVANPSIGEEELKLVTEAVKSGWISSRGSFIDEFAKNFANYCGTKYATTTSNGTTALHLALLALGIGKGDEVVVPTFTFAATVNTVAYTGATPVFVDSDPDYWCIDVDKLSEKITKKTKAIIPVHIYGHPCDMDPILKLARENNLYVIEDCAEAHGALYKGKIVGSFGDIACFSFYGNKIITTGEGGMCLTNSKPLLDKIELFKNHGMSEQKRYWHPVIGYNYRMTNLQAAIGVAQLKRIDKLIEKKCSIAKSYNDRLAPLAEKGLISLHPEMKWAKTVYWLYTILIKSKKMPAANMRSELLKKGIDARNVFYPIHTMPAYQSNLPFPVADSISNEAVTLPSGFDLTEENIDYICQQIKELLS